MKKRIVMIMLTISIALTGCTAASAKEGSGSTETEETVTALDTPSNENGSEEENRNEQGDNDMTGFAEKHGALHVDGRDLVDQNGEKIQLYGMSTHGIAWFPQFVSMETFTYLRDEWKTNAVRLAMYTYEYNGYCTDGNKEEIKQYVKNGVKYATDLGMYVIIDWHVLNEKSPLVYKDEAIKFFDEMSKEYGSQTNVIYEICNEPNSGPTWQDVKTYAEEVIPVIRKNDPDSVIIVGTTTWSQDVDQALADPLQFDNIMYTLHFYAATHKDDLRKRLEKCAEAGLPIMVTEFGICDASGNGACDEAEANKWMELLDKYNISFFCWNLANKDESSSIIKADCDKLSGWIDEDLNQEGIWVRNRFKSK